MALDRDHMTDSFLPPDDKAPPFGDDSLALRGNLPRVGSDISLRKLQIFWAVSHANSLTRAAKLLSLTQPTVSQQLAALEAAVGNKLFERINSGIRLTEFGGIFIRHAESVLRAAQELEDMVSTYGKGQLQTVRVAGVPSALRALMPKAMSSLRHAHNRLDFDIHEASPSDVLELLYARRINLALLGSNSFRDLAPGFAKLDLTEDPYVLVVPEALQLTDIRDPETQLPPEALEQLRSTIHFSFGNLQGRQLQQWYDQIIPGNHVVARARSFEMVVELVRAGLGVCVAPALSTTSCSATLNGVRIHKLNLTPRSITAIMPKHYLHHEPYASILTALTQAAAGLQRVPVLPEPAFVHKRSADLASPYR